MLKMIKRGYTVIRLILFAAILSLIREYYLASRTIVESQLTGNFRGLKHYDDGYVDSSRLHYLRDEMLSKRYSSTHTKIEGDFTLFLNDERERGAERYHHKGILRVSSENVGKWRKIRRLPKDSVFVVNGEVVRKTGYKYSKYVDDMRLVIDANHTILPGPNETQKRICNVLRELTGRDDLAVVPDRGIPPTVLNVTADCVALDQSISNGTENVFFDVIRSSTSFCVSKSRF